jgi:hypothetical protein
VSGCVARVLRHKPLQVREARVRFFTKACFREGALATAGIVIRRKFHIALPSLDRVSEVPQIG